MAAKRVETERAEEARIAQAVSAAEVCFSLYDSKILTRIQIQAELVSKTADILSLLRVRGAGIPNFITDDTERTAIYAATDALLGDDVERKHTVFNGFLFNAGNLNGVSCESP